MDLAANAARLTALEAETAARHERFRRLAEFWRAHGKHELAAEIDVLLRDNWACGE